MSTIIPQQNLDLFSKALNSSIEDSVKKDGPINVRSVIIGTFNGYLYLCKEQNIPEEKYLLIKNALQEIAEWYTNDVNVEDFSKLKKTSTRKMLELTNDKIFC